MVGKLNRPGTAFTGAEHFPQPEAQPPFELDQVFQVARPM